MDFSDVYLHHVLFPYIRFCYVTKSLPDIYILYVAITKGEFNEEKALVSSRFHLNSRMKLVTCYTWSKDFYNSVNWTLRKVDQKYLERFEICFWRKSNLVFRYICSPTRYTECFNGSVYSSLMLAQHVSDLIGPSSGAFYKLYSQTLVCGTTVRTARHVQPLQSKTLF